MEQITRLFKMDRNAAAARSQNLVGIDFATTATKVVRIKKVKDELSLVGLDMLPAVDFSGDSGRIHLPRNVLANYACLAYTGADSASVRLVNSVLAENEERLPDAKLRELLNVGENYRVSAALVQKGQGRKDSSFLTVAVPESDVQFMLDLFPSGPPAAASIEVSGISFMQAFDHVHGAECSDDLICLIEAGEAVTHYAFISRGTVVLVGKFPFGGQTLREKVVADLGVDDELAGTILSDASINVSSTIQSVITPFLKQLSISKDFIERHQGCRLAKVYVSGGLSMLGHWSEVMEQMLKTDLLKWNPFHTIQTDSANADPEFLEAQATRFSAAVGAAIGGINKI